MAYPHSGPLELDFELAVFHTLDERHPFAVGKEEGLLPRILGVSHCHTPGGDGDRDAIGNDPARGGLSKVTTTHWKLERFFHGFDLLSLRISYLSALQCPLSYYLIYIILSVILL